MNSTSGNLLQRILSSRRAIALLVSMVALIAIVAFVFATRAPKPVARAAEGEHKHEAHDHSHGDADEAHLAGVVLMPIEQQWAIKLKHVEVAHTEVAKQITATGHIVSAAGHQVVLAPPVGGMITGGHLPRVGQRVTKGQTLTVLRQHLTAGEAAQIAAAQSQLQIEQAKLEAERKRLTQKIEEAIASLKASLPADVKIETKAFQQADFIKRAIYNIEEALGVGAVLVLIVLFAFLWNFRTTFISLTAIPLSLLAAILAMRYFGVTINTMTLGGLAIAIGELVDDAIVDIENVFRRLKQNAQLPLPQPALTVIFQASSEIRNSIVFATLIVMLVFLPLFALGGFEGRMFAPRCKASPASLTCSSNRRSACHRCRSI